MKNNNFISIGKIVNFHGVKGEAKLGYSKNREEFLAQLDIVYIKKDNEYKEFEIENLRFTPKYAIIKLKGIDSLNEIINFKGDIFLSFVLTDNKSLAPLLETPTTDPIRVSPS